jgi:DNA-binding transcriptional regulator YdaS (Cro superfamily)
MLKKDVIQHFGKGKFLCKALNITSGSVSQWGKVIPEKQALRLERITAGKLQYDPALYVKAA